MLIVFRLRIRLRLSLSILCDPYLATPRFSGCLSTRHRHRLNPPPSSSQERCSRWLDTSSVARSCLADLAVCQKPWCRQRLGALLQLHQGRRLRRRWREHHLVIRLQGKVWANDDYEKPLLRRPHRNHPASRSKKGRLPHAGREISRSYVF